MKNRGLSLFLICSGAVLCATQEEDIFNVPEVNKAQETDKHYETDQAQTPVTKLDILKTNANTQLSMLEKTIEASSKRLTEESLKPFRIKLSTFNDIVKNAETEEEVQVSISEINDMIISLNESNESLVWTRNKLSAIKEFVNQKIRGSTEE